MKTMLCGSWTSLEFHSDLSFGRCRMDWGDLSAHMGLEALKEEEEKGEDYGEFNGAFNEYDE